DLSSKGRGNMGKSPTAESKPELGPFTTVIEIENMKPGKSRYERPDKKCSGLRIIVQPSGVKSWAVRYRMGRRAVKFTLGRYLPEGGKRPKASADPQVGDFLTLSDARKLAVDTLHQVN